MPRTLIAHPLPRTLYQRQRRARIRQARLEAGWRDGRYRDPSTAPAPPYLAVQRWRLAHRDEARFRDRIYKGMKRHPLFVRAWPLILAHYGPGCVKCGSMDRVGVDHVQPVLPDPLVRNVLSNMQPLCRSCNTWKRSRVEDYRPDAGAWIVATFGADASVALHNTKPRARYGSNGWKLVKPVSLIDDSSGTSPLDTHSHTVNPTIPAVSHAAIQPPCNPLGPA
jgi:hypothetical protein